MNFELTFEDFTIIQNALHYYKHVEKRGNFKQYDEKRCEVQFEKCTKNNLVGGESILSTDGTGVELL